MIIRIIIEQWVAAKGQWICKSNNPIKPCTEDELRREFPPAHFSIAIDQFGVALVQFLRAAN